MASIEFKRRPAKNIRSRRALRKYEPKVFENPKSVLMLRGQSTSQVVNDAMVDLGSILKPHVKKLTKRNAFHAFEGQQHLEFLGFKNDASMFCFASDSKKRPHNLVLGRHYAFRVLDMIEVGILAMDPLDTSQVKGFNTCSLGSKPVFVFEGSEFVSDPFFMRLKNFLLDFFQGSVVSELSLANLDRVVSVSLRSSDGASAVVSPPESGSSGGASPVICFRHYALLAGGATAAAVGGAVSDPKKLSLVDVGPNFDLEIRRHKFAAAPEFKRACRLPKQALASIRSMHENVGEDAMGNLRGAIHVGKQDLSGLALRKFVGRRRVPGASTVPAEGADSAKRPRKEADEGQQAVDGEAVSARAAARRRRSGKAGNDRDDEAPVDI